MKYKNFLLTLIFTFSYFSPVRGANEVGPEKKYFLVYDFKYDWLVYSPQYKNFIPFSKELHETELSVSLFVDLLKNRKYELLITTPKENYLFIEGSLQKKIEPGEWLNLKIDSLYQVYRKDELLITLYGSPGIESKTVYIVHPKSTIRATIATKTKSISQINIKPVKTTAFEDFSILIFLALLLLVLFTYSTTPSLFRRFLNITDFIDISERNDLYRYSRPYTRVILLNAITISACMGYLVLYLNQHDVELFNTGSSLSDGNNLIGLLLDQLKLTSLFTGLFFIKYLMMGIVGGVLNIEKVVNMHYIKALQVSFLFYGLLTIAFLGLLFQVHGWFDTAQPYLLYLFIFFYIFRFALMYLFTNYSGQLINLYLFSYLCVIEIIPLIVGVKYAT